MNALRGYVIVVLLGLVGAQADAQSYYMRQKLSISPTTAPTTPPIQPGYSGTWSSTTTTGSCVAGVKTTTTTGACTGGECDPSQDPSKTTQDSCTLTCTGWTTGRLSEGREAVPGTPYLQYNGTADMHAKAAAVCATSTKTVYSCSAVPFTSSGKTYAQFYIGTKPGYLSQIGHYSVCS
jgi:hypothetical protein